MSVKKDRIIGIDLLKVISIILVLIVHFFLNTNYYNVERIGISLTFQSIIRNGCMVCVPLFITITGFLNKEKEYNKKFFIKLLEIIIIWLFYGVIEFVVLGIMNKSFLINCTTFAIFMSTLVVVLAMIQDFI